MLSPTLLLLPLSTLLPLALSTPDFSKWAPPGPTDVRGPCPALNSLANHGFINHTGRNLTVADVAAANEAVFNLSPELASTVARIGFEVKPEPRNGFFDLPDLNRHNAFEHDASLSRDDYDDEGVGAANVARFSQRQFDEWFAHFDGLDYIENKVAAKARYHMVQRSRARNPAFTYEVLHQTISYSETVKFMRAMVDGTGKTKTEFVRILFEQERLPYNEGWRPPVDMLNGFLLGAGALELSLSTPEKALYLDEVPPEGQEHQTTFDVPVCYGTDNPDSTTTRRHVRDFNQLS
ncbi:Cloroperoxidase [Pseudovirgaria hyperparasitica]|uniref:Cloroperoxidase n=1 Tax=Pseudovirgaria hyperparasitica TaxID=470096 RepID=A0A6A6WF07_9PEZI|nr:Cloroperoxidase [Pseudovirgaria hyperparasitica]KAF2760167.1 Cloroperoxidase [Pseudovirgaria hyperparasitica]